MKTLKSLCRLPFVTASGEIIATPGFHEESEVYSHFEADALPPLPDNPDRGQIVAAIKTAMQPWSGYRFATPEDRAAMLAAIMTAVCRPALELAPGVFFDAPVQASGKTKAAGALGALMKGRRAGVTPYVSGQNAEAELLKKLVAVCVAGETFMLFDNVVGTWRSAVLAAMITEGQINERLLGANQWHRGAARIMVCATGNNASLDLDLGRRFLRVRIDPGVECPQARSFTFDPVDAALASRLAIAHAVLVLVTAYQAAGSPTLGRGDAGFADWNRLVRRVVLWVQAEGYAEEAGFGPMGDPAHSIMEAAAADDPETDAARMLIQGLGETFHAECFTAREVYALYLSGRGEVFEALHAILGRRDISPVSVGRVLLNRRDKIVGGLVLRRVGETRQGATWMVAPG
ncbi:MAG: hypothetical protein D3M94_14005 [Rhodocyclales bacterium GT-UBC]|nr:MAG: hypothetical protein D3M94_14005 [Rhodocyclales bacterium GT-UBC]